MNIEDAAQLTQSYYCLDCGHSGIPIYFSTEEERQRFKEELAGEKEKIKDGE